MFRSGSTRGFLAGFLVASVLFGGAAMAADLVQKDIRVSYLPLKFMFDGVEKAPPADQQGFTYNGRTYVPLRFAAESLGKRVDYDPATYTIYMGRRPAPLPEVWKTYKVEGEADVKLQYYSSGMLTATGKEMPESLLFTALSNDLSDSPFKNSPTVVSTEIQIDGKYSSLSGTLFVPDQYLLQASEEQIAHVSILNELNQPLYRSPVIMSRAEPLSFNIELVQVQKVRILVSMYPNGIPAGHMTSGSYLGLSNLKWQ